VALLEPNDPSVPPPTELHFLCYPD
jgi:hypothetical protein